MKIVFVLFALLLCPAMVHADRKSQQNIKPIVVEGEAVLSEDSTPAQARALAFNNARRSAIEQASGVIVHGSSVVYNFQLISDLVASATRGVIVKEEILQDEIRKEGKQIVYYVKLKAHVKALEGREKSPLKLVNTNVVRYGSPSSSTTIVFQENDEIQVHAKTSIDSYIHVFSITHDGMVSKLYPNEYFKGERISAGSEFVFPDERQRSMGLKLRVRTPKNISRAVETILFVATKEKNDFLSNKNSDEVTITDLMQELSEHDASLWVEKAVGYEIRK
ncbi:MAG: DUF4384 domain-containing protein [Nitrospirae bacterium]|nr:MAG: DUF4384 domain-containing protein [Nitrospirota bacterium]